MVQRALWGIRLRIKLSFQPRAPYSRAIGALATLALAGSVLSAAPAGAVGSGTEHATPVSAVPAAYTPNVTNGVVYAITGVGTSIVVGGSFTGVQNHGSSTTLTRNRLVAFNAGTGAVSTTFAPNLDGTVEAVYPGPTANTVYVGGAFNNVNGVKSKGITLLNTTNGSIVTGFKPPVVNGVVYGIARVGNRVLLAGTFTQAGSVAHGGLASLNASTGALDPFMSVQVAGHHNYDGTSGANGAVGPRAIAVNPAGTRAMVIGNFKTADGLARDQIAMIDLDGSQAQVDPNWSTGQYTAACFNWAFDTYMTDVQYSADGTYFVVTATGGSGNNNDGSNSLCDTAARWDSSATGSDVHATWVDYTGQDSLWTVQITGSAVYVGGHQRWLNNSHGYDNPGPGAVPRPGLAALDPVSGVPLTWNPGRNPRGAGAYALYASSSGLYVGSDTDYIGNRKYLHKKVAFFPLAGGVATASTATAQLPSNLYMAGSLPQPGSTNVLYRVDAGGPALAATDNGPDWQADASDSDPGAQYHDTGSNTAPWDCCAALAPTVPPSTPVSLFNSERWAESHWSFPVPDGTHVQVRLYFANRYPGTSNPGDRVFNVSVDGTQVLSHYDIVADVGDQTGTMKQFDVTAPASGMITIDLGQVQENPLINGIELINTDAAAGGGPSLDTLAYRSINGNQIGSLTQVPTGGVAWGSTRGAFMVGNTIFYGTSSDSFYRATFNAGSVGTPTLVDPYNDPVWSNVSTGSGQNYRGTPSGYYGELNEVTGAFYSGGRLYYTLLGQPDLYSRWFSPDSGIVGSEEFSTSGADLSNVAGMVLSGSTLYFADRTTGDLHTVPFANGVAAGSDTIVSGPGLDGRDWRARGMFLNGAGSSGGANVAYVNGASANSRTTANPSVTVPTGVSAGDTELLFVTTNAAGKSSAPTGLSGWTQIAKQTSSALETIGYRRTATAGDSGSTVTVPLSSAIPTDLQFADYSGVAGGAPTSATATDANQLNHVTPTVSVAGSGSWVLSYWADKNSAATSTWSLPNTVTPRGSSVGTGGGHVDGAFADSGAAVPAGNYGGQSASTGAVSGKGNMLSVVLAPA